MAKKLIINADDYGISRSGVDSVLNLRALGVITNATLASQWILRAPQTRATEPRLVGP